MTYLAMMLMDNDFPPGIGLWIFLSVGAVALFVVFIPTVIYLENRRKEREAYYKAETMRRITEASGEGAKAVLETMREEARRERLKAREGLKVGGLINIGVGIGLIVFLHALIGGGSSPYLCGLIPGFIGIAMLVYVYALAAPIE